MIGYVKSIDSNKTMYFKVRDNKLLKKYKKIWEKVGNLLNIEFDSEPVYGDVDKYMKTKKTYGDKVNTNFQGQKVPKENASYKCISLIMLDSVIGVNKKYYPQTLLEEFKCAIRKNKMENLVNHDLSLTSSDESDHESDKGDNEYDNESDKYFLIMMNLIINFSWIKCCFNNNKRLSCMAHLAIHKTSIMLLKHHFIL